MTYKIQKAPGITEFPPVHAHISNKVLTFKIRYKHKITTKY